MKRLAMVLILGCAVFATSLLKGTVCAFIFENHMDEQIQIQIKTDKETIEGVIPSAKEMPSARRDYYAFRVTGDTLEAIRIKGTEKGLEEFRGEGLGKLLLEKLLIECKGNWLSNNQIG